MKRAYHIPAPQMFNLHHACLLVRQAFPESYGVFLVGSSLERPDYRDVDVRCVLPDEAFDALFPGTPNAESAHQWEARWTLMSVAISQWLSQASGLPIDFQFQKASLANERFKGPRNALGIYVSHGDARKA